jgi:hypothetical protein
LKESRYYSEQCGFHWWTFTPKSLRKLFERYGFKVQELLKDTEKTEQILNLELALCEDPNIIGCGGHLHIVAKKVKFRKESVSPQAYKA